jgi:D-glycero-D-manno-heptose 1,7-bisphosphate phosphatase
VSRPGIFLDRDGTIIVESNYLGDPKGAILEKDAVKGLVAMAAMGYPLIVVSNQSGIARGLFTDEHARAVNARVDALLLAQGVEILAWYFCPHDSQSSCDCRKPRPGMLIKAAREHDLDLGPSFIIGDKYSDLEAGAAVQVRGVLVRTGYGDRQAEIARKAGYTVCDDLIGAAAFIRNSSR